MQAFEVNVKYSSGAYTAQAKGQRVSCTTSAEEAARRLGQKLLGDAFARVEAVSHDGAATSRWRIVPRVQSARSELLEWHDAVASKPDADIQVLMWIEDEAGNSDWAAGWWSGTEWIYSETGGRVRGTVRYYAQPEGPGA